MLCFLCQHLMLSDFSALAMLEYTGSTGSLLHSSQHFPGGLGCYLLPWSLPGNVSVQSFACFLLGPLSCSYSHTLPLSPFLSFCWGGDARKPWWSLICRLLLVLCSEKNGEPFKGMEGQRGCLPNSKSLLLVLQVGSVCLPQSLHTRCQGQPPP